MPAAPQQAAGSSILSTLQLVESEIAMPHKIELVAMKLYRALTAERACWLSVGVLCMGRSLGLNVLPGNTARALVNTLSSSDAG